MEIKLKTLTPLWTGGVDQTCDRLHETGLIGSLRWWYESLVRGLGGYACDPTDDNRCPDKDGKHCAACELFGCTGWARKFRLRVLDEKAKLIKDLLKQNITFSLEFLEMRSMGHEEKWLIAKAVETAARYGALGGKTTLKPQKDQRKGADYGIVQWVSTKPEIMKPNIRDYLRHSAFRTVSIEIPDLRWFFFVNGAFFWRNQMNLLLGLDPREKPLLEPNIQKFLQGTRGKQGMDASSKKLFSFRADGGRIWGYAKNANMRDAIIEQVKQKLKEKKYSMKTGEEVLYEL